MTGAPLRDEQRAEPRVMRQVAPYPDDLADVVARLRYRQHLGWRVRLDDDLQRDPPDTHGGESRGMTLAVLRHGPDTYHPADIEQAARLLLRALAGVDLPEEAAAAAAGLRDALGRLLTVYHYFPVPPATFDRDTWTRWVFDTLGLVDDHERMEDFALATPDGEAETRPFAPNHGPGRNPYVVHEYAADTDRRTSFRGEVQDS
jgi:hypothetical protein